MKEYQRAGLHHVDIYREKRVVEWGVYKWMMRRGRVHETRARWDRLTRQMWKEWGAQWGIRRKVKRRRAGARAVHEKVLYRGEREKARPGILLCAPLGLKGPRGKVQSASGQCYDVHPAMFWRDNSPGVPGQGDQCWRSTKKPRQVPWLVLRITAWAFQTTTMRTTDVRGQWWGPVVRLPRKVHEDKVAQGERGFW